MKMYFYLRIFSIISNKKLKSTGQLVNTEVKLALRIII
jgi:hypothetical protein